MSLYHHETRYEPGDYFNRFSKSKNSQITLGSRLFVERGYPCLQLLVISALVGVLFLGGSAYADLKWGNAPTPFGSKGLVVTRGWVQLLSKLRFVTQWRDLQPHREMEWTRYAFRLSEEVFGGISEKTYLRVKHSRGFFSTEIYE